MSNTQIHISSGATGTFSASPGSAPFNTGDSVTFTSAAGAEDALICFSDSASGILSPSPDSQVALSGGSSVTFSVNGPPQAGCCATVVATGHGGTPDGSNLPPGVLMIMTPNRRPAPGDPGQR